jgi:hypothetical protein
VLQSPFPPWLRKSRSLLLVIYKYTVSLVDIARLLLAKNLSTQKTQWEKVAEREETHHEYQLDSNQYDDLWDLVCLVGLT